MRRRSPASFAAARCGPSRRRARWAAPASAWPERVAQPRGGVGVGFARRAFGEAQAAQALGADPRLEPHAARRGCWRRRRTRPRRAQRSPARSLTAAHGVVTSAHTPGWPASTRNQRVERRRFGARLLDGGFDGWARAALRRAWSARPAARSRAEARARPARRTRRRGPPAADPPPIQPSPRAGCSSLSGPSASSASSSHQLHREAEPARLGQRAKRRRSLSMRKQAPGGCAVAITRRRRKPGAQRRQPSAERRCSASPRLAAAPRARFGVADRERDGQRRALAAHAPRSRRAPASVERTRPSSGQSGPGRQRVADGASRLPRRPRPPKRARSRANDAMRSRFELGGVGDATPTRQLGRALRDRAGRRSFGRRRGRQRRQLGGGERARQGLQQRLGGQTRAFRRSRPAGSARSRGRA